VKRQEPFELVVQWSLNGTNANMPIRSNNSEKKGPGKKINITMNSHLSITMDMMPIQ